MGGETLREDTGGSGVGAVWAAEFGEFGVGGAVAAASVGVVSERGKGEVGKGGYKKNLGSPLHVARSKASLSAAVLATGLQNENGSLQACS